MSKILRRPMFRGGGKISSYGNGITAPLVDGYASGGSINTPKRGIVDGPGRYSVSMSGLENYNNIFNKGSGAGTGSTGTTTGGQLLNQNVRPMQGPPQSPQMNAIEKRLSQGLRGTARNKIVQGGLNRIGAFAGANPFTAMMAGTAAMFAPTAGLAYMNRPKTVEALEYMKSMNQSGVFDETAMEGEYEDFTATIDELNRTGTPLKEVGMGIMTGQKELDELLNNQAKNRMTEDDAYKLPDGIKTEPEGNVDANGNLKNKKNNEEDTEIGVQDLIETNSAMFNEMLSKGTEERNEKRLKKARIADISDIGLDIFAKSTKEGATVKSMLGEAAERMVNKPSRTETLMTKQEDASDKTQQTAVAIAINDFIAGKRSAESLDKLIASKGIDFDIRKAIAGMSKKNLAQNIASSGAVGVGQIKEGVQMTYPNRPLEMVTSTEKLQFDETDVGVIFIETDTENVYIVDKDGNKSRLYTG